MPSLLPPSVGLCSEGSSPSLTSTSSRSSASGTTPRVEAPAEGVTATSASAAELSEDSVRLLVAGCSYHAVKCWGDSKVPKDVTLQSPSDTLRLVARPFDDSEVTELFIGQLPFDVDPMGLVEIFQLLLGVKSQRKPIVYRLKTGAQPTCAFVAVQNQFAERLLAHTKRVLCDRSGFWVAPLGDAVALQALFAASESRRRRPMDDIPSIPMVIERIQDGKLGTREPQKRGKQLGKRQPPPPPYFLSGPVATPALPFAPIVLIPQVIPSLSLYPGMYQPLPPAPPVKSSSPSKKAHTRPPAYNHSNVPTLAPQFVAGQFGMLFQTAYDATHMGR